MDCIFCKIVKGEIPSKKVFENDNVLAFHDIQPLAPSHVLVIPKKHIASMNEAEEEDKELLGEVLLTAKKVANELGIADGGYRLINNVGSDGGQVVYHIHVHVIGGEKLGGLNVKG
ncbi:histidine triad nucleotide-binding protein [Paenibacillus hemerocallicola]|uniref:Histidine triad nucleotide-binding protein n=1 Tax=Paenibacillus hemerocallicola TaxID=1172614 RepID=A0A5C4T671_9BACL|nr:histidine triad nucleotide-binding protein [Paenibacillus hemerocallicola]TNJ64130.1 histidine triad nucleotide-binding protein [Paenibacillus hemerocallicola]